MNKLINSIQSNNLNCIISILHLKGLLKSSLRSFKIFVILNWCKDKASFINKIDAFQVTKR